VYTTGQVAELLQVAPRTVVKWFDSGRLPGYRVPGSADRRIPRESLLRFLRDNGLLWCRPAAPDEEQRSFEEHAGQTDSFLIGDLARILHVAPRTVIKWFDGGRLHGRRDGAGRRHVSREELLCFLRDNGMPIPEFLEETIQETP
jgi:excisionase family DNA binding protein